MRVLIHGYYRLLQIVLTCLMAILLVPVTMQIASRYSTMIPRYIWTEELARFCFIWIIMIGAMIAVRDRTHFDVDLLPRSPNPKINFLAQLVVHGAIMVMALSFLWWGIDFYNLGARQRSEIFGLPMHSIYVAWPMAGATWALFTLENIWNDYKKMQAGYE
ncbi:MAG: TRAP transporter small permease [Pseudorhodobacter sp.]